MKTSRKLLSLIIAYPQSSLTNDGGEARTTALSRKHHETHLKGGDDMDGDKSSVMENLKKAKGDRMSDEVRSPRSQGKICRCDNQENGKGRGLLQKIEVKKRMEEKTSKKCYSPANNIYFSLFFIMSFSLLFTVLILIIKVMHSFIRSRHLLFGRTYRRIDSCFGQ